MVQKTGEHSWLGWGLPQRAGAAATMQLELVLAVRRLGWRFKED